MEGKSEKGKMPKNRLDKANPPRQHFCPSHDVLVKATRIGPGKGRMVWDCPQGCRLEKRQTVVK